jgi:hypothetical protein
VNKFVLLSILLSASTLADIYQWTDEDGKVYFSDKPPRQQSVENISNTTKHVNVDSGESERRKVGKVFAPPTQEEVAYEQQQAQGQTQQQSAKQEYCNKLNKELNFFQTERFYWVDDEGNPTQATEAERWEKIKALQAAIAKDC